MGHVSVSEANAVTCYYYISEYVPYEESEDKGHRENEEDWMVITEDTIICKCCAKRVNAMHSLGAHNQGQAQACSN